VPFFLVGSAASLPIPDAPSLWRDGRIFPCRAFPRLALTQGRLTFLTPLFPALLWWPFSGSSFENRPYRLNVLQKPSQTRRPCLLRTCNNFPPHSRTGFCPSGLYLFSHRTAGVARRLPFDHALLKLNCLPSPLPPLMQARPSPIPLKTHFSPWIDDSLLCLARTPFGML